MIDSLTLYYSTQTYKKLIGKKHIFPNSSRKFTVRLIGCK